MIMRWQMDKCLHISNHVEVLCQTEPRTQTLALRSLSTSGMWLRPRAVSHWTLTPHEEGALPWGATGGGGGGVDCKQPSQARYDCKKAATRIKM